MLHALFSLPLSAGNPKHTCRCPGRSVAVYVTMATHRRTPHSPHVSAVACAWAAGYLGAIPVMPCTCTCHSSAPAPVVPASCECDLLWRGCVLCDCVLCTTRPHVRAIGSFLTARQEYCLVLLMMMITPRFHKNAAKPCHTKRNTHHAQAPALLTAPVLTRYPRHQLVRCPLSCVPPLTCRPASRVPA